MWQANLAVVVSVSVLLAGGGDSGGGGGGGSGGGSGTVAWKTTGQQNVLKKIKFYLNFLFILKNNKILKI